MIEALSQGVACFLILIIIFGFVIGERQQRRRNRRINGHLSKNKSEPKKENNTEKKYLCCRCQKIKMRNSSYSRRCACFDSKSECPYGKRAKWKEGKPNE